MISKQKTLDPGRISDFVQLSGPKELKLVVSDPQVDSQ
jgi:hypothetical protein